MLSVYLLSNGATYKDDKTSRCTIQSKIGMHRQKSKIYKNKVFNDAKK